MHRNVAARSILIKKEETNKLEQEAEQLEQELRRIRELRTAATSAPPQNDRATASAAPRWRSAVEGPEDDSSRSHERGIIEVPAEEIEALFRASGDDTPWNPTVANSQIYDSSVASGSGGVGNAQQRADSERPRVRRAGEFGSVETFLGELGLSRYVTLFHERGLNSLEAILNLDIRKLRSLGIDNRHQQKLRMGIAELRAFATPPATSARGAPTAQVRVVVPPSPSSGSVAFPADRPPLAPRRPSISDTSGNIPNRGGIGGASSRARSFDCAPSAPVGRSRGSRVVRARIPVAR